MSRPGNYDYHIARILILLRHFAPPESKPLKGLAKLAKLDFLLRYPSMTDRLLEQRNLAWPLGANPLPEEFIAVESRMIRYKYGPWDNRYYGLLGALLGLGLAVVSRDSRGVVSVQLTEEGQRRAAEVAESEDWTVIDVRAELLRTHFDFTGSRLTKLIYEQLPDAVGRPHRVEI